MTRRRSSTNGPEGGEHRPPRKHGFPSFTIAIRWAGLAIVLFETLVEHVDRPSLLVLAAGMMGLHSVVQAQDGGHT